MPALTVPASRAAVTNADQANLTWRPSSWPRVLGRPLSHLGLLLEGHRSGVAVPGPRSEKQEQCRIGARRDGMALAGPVSALIGIDETLWLSVAIFLAATAIIVSIPSVRAIRAPSADDAVPTLP